MRFALRPTAAHSEKTVPTEKDGRIPSEESMQNEKQSSTQREVIDST